MKKKEFKSKWKKIFKILTSKKRFSQQCLRLHLQIQKINSNKMRMVEFLQNHTIS